MNQIADQLILVFKIYYIAWFWD